MRLHIMMYDEMTSKIKSPKQVSLKYKLETKRKLMIRGYIQESSYNMDAYVVYVL